MRIYTGLIFILVACGSPEPGSDGEETKLTTQGEPSPADPAAENSPKAEYAQLVADVAALPACDAATEGRLYYAKAEAQFQVCAATAWSVIDLKGVAGVKGDKGDKGDQGEAGANGKDASSTSWLDLQTGSTWIVTANAVYANAASHCSGDYALPTRAQLMAAALHGLKLGLPSGSNIAWTNEDFPTNSWAYTISNIGSNPAEGGTDKTETHGVYCVAP